MFTLTIFQSPVQIHEFHVFITIDDDDDEDDDDDDDDDYDDKDDESGKKHFKMGNRRGSKNNLKKIEGVTCCMMTSEFSIASSSSV